jgi:hypothetical protein
MTKSQTTTIVIVLIKPLRLMRCLTKPIAYKITHHIGSLADLQKDSLNFLQNIRREYDIAQRYRLELVPGHIIEPEPMITLRC